jgi:hypothetical protein
MNKYIHSWSLSVHDTGIYQLVINTNERWLDYHRYNDEWFIVGTDLEEDYEELKIEEFLPEVKGTVYICSSNQNKDQIIFYWIPITKDTLRNLKLIKHGKPQGIE